MPRTENPAMWKLAALREPDVPQTCINSMWVPVRPVNYQPRYCSILKRIRYAWQVILGNTETFIWPEDEIG